VSALSCQWWFIGLLSLAVLSSVLAALSFRSRTRAHVNRDMRQPVLQCEGEVLPSRGLGDPNGVERCIDLAFVSIVVLCAALFLLSQLPGWESPVWLGLALQAFTYFSAAIFQVSG
jgi:hypothetical protein